MYVEGGRGFFVCSETDDEGRFEETGLFHGTYVVDVNSPKLRYPVLGKADVHAGETARANFRH